MKEYINVAIIQPSINEDTAWSKYNPFFPNMEITEAARAWRQIHNSLTQYINIDTSTKPDIIVLPELNIAKQYGSQIKKISEKLGSIIIGGLDFKKENNYISNNAFVCIPKYWPHDKGTKYGKTFLFGKKHPSANELKYVTSNGDKWDPCNKFYILDLNDYGKIGLAICADFYDIERYALYKGRIQHLIILAFNRDIKSFYFLAESISRLVFCNVIICNTGHYGGSVCFSPTKAEYNRYIYKHEGKDLFTSQIVKLPVNSLFEAQINPNRKDSDYKTQPPGYKYRYQTNNNKENKK